MFQACRPAGRLFYWVLAAMLVTASSARVWAREGSAEKAGKTASSPTAKPAAAEPVPGAASPAPQSSPALTSVIDTVFMADGSEAQGVLIITWPAFVGADGTAVAPGASNVTLGVNGALSVALAPNAGATPAGTYYTVVYQLQPSEVRTEYWVVPTSSPATLAQVRTTPGTGTAAAPVSMQYVNSALAAKANDDAVVHLAGTETVTGTKSFVVPPNVPTPVNTGDVTNKAYVDAAISTVGAGNYLPTAGGAMSGPLTLSGNPTAPLQAAAKQYVDLSVAAKADLISGLVPTSELGSGTASALNCLLGSGAWGPCGSSANATAIQSVPVASGAPANGQVLTYSSSSGQYAPATPSGGSGGLSASPAASQNIVQPTGTEFSTNNLSNITYATPSYNWILSPTGSLSVGSNTVTLSPCPMGILSPSTAGYPTRTPWTWVHIGGTGTAEDAVITATTCTQQGGTNGTVTFVAANVHSNGYFLTSSSMGVQEAINAAMQPIPGESGLLVGGHTIVPPLSTLYVWTARVTVFAQQARLEFMDGARVSCAMQDTCLYIGDTAFIASTNDVTVSNFHFDAGVPNGNYPAVEDHGQSVKMIDFAPFYNYQRPTGASFGSLIQVDSDESAIIDHLDLSIYASTNGTGSSHCGTDFCEVAVKGNSAGAPVIWVKNSNLSLSCSMNGVDNQGANTLRISDSIIQAQAQFGVRATSTYNNVPSVELDNTYFEVGGCANLNPLGIGIAGLIVEGGFASVKNTVGPVGSAQVFANTGSTQYNYYVVAHSSTYGASAPFLAGIAETNGSGTIAVKWPEFGSSGTITYDVIRTSGIANHPAPYTAVCSGGSTTTCGSVATGLTVASVCSAVGSTNICTFSDTASTSTANYTVTTPPTYWPALPFWNGSVIYTTQNDAVGVSPSPSGVHFDRLGDNVASSGQNPVSQLVSSFGALVPKFFAQDCNSTFGGAWLSCVEHTEGPIGATLLDSGTYNAADSPGLKGRLIFEEGLYGDINGGQKITIADSNPAKTLATGGMRPTEDANDTYIGLDNTTTASAGSAQLAFGAPTSISNYIGSNPDNVSFLERLTTSAKTFNVPVNVNGNLTVTGTCTGCGSGAVNSGTATQVALYATNGVAVSGDSGLTDSGSTLNYTGSNGIAAAAGTFSGNVTVNGQLLVAGPWMVSSPVPGTAMGAAGAGTSALGISNDGNFYISANAGTPQKVATTATSSYFSNLFQEDANDLGEYNGTTPQNLHVYSSYTNSSTWQRISLGLDVGDSYAVLRSESSPSGSAYGLGFWINNGLKWVVDASGNFKPWTDQTYNVGSFNSAGSGSGLRPGTVYAAGNSASGSGFELGRFANQSYELCNDTSTGTVVNGLAVLSSAGCAIKPSSALTSGAIGVLIANAGTSGVATLARTGSAYCSFDGTATVVGDYVVPSSTANSGFYPLCHDAGGTQPSGMQVLGRVLQASSGSTTVQMFLDMPGSNVSTSAAYSIPWFTTNTTGTAISFSSTASKTELWGVVLTFPLTTTQVTYDVSTADNTSNTYDIGVLNSSGNIVAHIGNTAGTTFAASTGYKTLSWTASATLQPGKYYLAITSSCTSSCAQIYGGSSAGFTFLGGSSGTAESVTTGGTLNNGITIPADNPTEATIMAWEIH